MSKRILVGLLVVLLLVSAGVVLVIVQPFGHPTSHHVTGNGVASPTTQIMHQPLPTTDVANIQNSMNSPEVSTQSLAWVPELRHAYIASVKNPLPEGTKLVIDAKSFWFVRNYGEVQATAGTHKYILHVERFDGQWLIAWTS